MPLIESGILIAEYRTWPFEGLARTFTLRSIEDVEPDSTGRRTLVTRPDAVREDPVFGSFTGLRRSGSIRRGFVTGNRRDVSLESGLRLELEGEIAPGLNLQAVLTDENTPIQPEGTTQRLSDLDRVYIQLDSRHGQARLGDVDLHFSGSTFAPFNRRLQGAALQANLPSVGNGFFAGGTVTVAGAVTRGLFRSQDVPLIEVVQGPYRLLGRNGEELIIVVAGSERVYLDGVLLTRGEADDYVIDYGTGEITFTARHLITSERRLTVDFEYSLGAFTRTLIASEIDLSFGARSGGLPPLIQLRTTLLREADGSAFGDEFGLTEADLDLIAESGIHPAVRPGADRVPWDAESPFVLYALRDTVVAGEMYSIYVLAGPQDDEVYRVRFSRVEPGTGEYRRGGHAVNGVMYEWVGPTGGDYVPLRILPKPESRRLIDIVAVITPVEGVELFGEIANSGADVNRLSDIAETTSDGSAFEVGARIRDVETLGGRVSGEIVGRHRESTFEAFERIRHVEFNRRWNIAQSGSSIAALDSLAESSVEGFAQWIRESGTSFRIEGGILDLQDMFSGQRFAGELRFNEARLPTLHWRTDWIQSTNMLDVAPQSPIRGEEGDWLRQYGRLGYRLTQSLEPFLEFEQEHRRQTAPGSDSLLVTAISFEEIRPGMNYTSENLVGSIAMGWRNERLPLNGVFGNAAQALTFHADASYRPNADFSTEVEANYRRRFIEEDFREQGLGDTESVAMRWTTRWSPFERALELNTVYSASTERSPLLQEMFIHVGPELGEWVWEDLNGDGIQQVDEFRPQITPLEGEYLRVFIPGDELRPTASVQAQVRLRFDPARIFDPDATDWRRLLRQVVSTTTIDVQERTESDDLLAVYFLQPSILQNPESTLQGRIRVAQELALFREHSRFGGRIAGSHLQTMSTMTSGVDLRRIQRLEAEAQWQIITPIGLRLRGMLESNDSQSGLASRTYDLLSQEIEPEATWRISRAVSLSGGMRWSYASDQRSSADAHVVVLPLRAMISAAGRMQFNLRLERADVTLSGPETSGQLFFELTQRRGPGTSYLWSASGQYTINRYLRASLNIEGIAPANAPVTHNIRLQMSAVF